MKPIPRLHPGDRQLSSAGFNTMAQAVEGLASSSGLGHLGPWGLALDLQRQSGPVFINALIQADASQPGQYTWTEQIWNPSLGSGAGGWNSGYESDATLGTAIELNGLDMVALGQRVTLQLFFDSNGSPALFFQSPRNWIWVKLTSAMAVSANIWAYSGTRQMRTSTGWEDFSPATDIDDMINAMEANNSGGTTPGVQGNGVNHTTTANGGTFPTSYAMQPLSAGSPVVMAWRERLADGTRVWTLQSPNADDGACPS